MAEKPKENNAFCDGMKDRDEALRTYWASDAKERLRTCLAYSQSDVSDNEWGHLLQITRLVDQVEQMTAGLSSLGRKVGIRVSFV